MASRNRFFGSKNKSKSKAFTRSIVLRLEHFEERLAPVVGAFTEPAKIAPLVTQPASPYDGVVRIAVVDAGTLSGSLIQTGTGRGFGHQILTVAHNIGETPSNVWFNLQRGGNPIPIRINVPANVGGGAQYQIRHSAYADFINDVGIMLLVDQTDPSPDRLLVAPFTAQQYGLSLADAVGQQFTMVGYGRSGVGATGDTVASGIKRTGQNRFDASATQWHPTHSMNLMFDFDRLNDPGGLANIDPLGALFKIANPGLGAAEASNASGDSGGPAFVGANLIAGVLASNASGDGNVATNSSFGQFGFATNLSMTIGNAALQSVLNPANPAYDLVLDMNQQVLGLDAVNENITIVAKRNGVNLELIISGSADNSLNGKYYSAPASNIKSLTIRGSNGDNETFRIEGPLGLTGTKEVTLVGRGGDDKFIIYGLQGAVPNGDIGIVRIDGDGGAPGFGNGNDEIEIHEEAATGDGHHYTIGLPLDAGWDMTLNRATNNGGAMQNQSGVHSKNLEKYTLNAGLGADVIRVEKGPSTLTGGGMFINANDGLDEVYVGAGAGGFDPIQTSVHINGEAGKAKLTYLDDTGTGPRSYVLGLSDNPGFDMRLGVVNGLTTVYSKSITEYTLKATDASDTVQIDATSATATKTSLFGNGGSDTVNIGTSQKGLDSVITNVFVTGGAGIDSLIVDDINGAQGQTYTVTKTKIEKANGPTVETLDLMRRKLKTRDPKNPALIIDVLVRGNDSGAETDLDIIGGVAANRVAISDNATLDNVLGNITFTGNTGNDRIVFGDLANAKDETYTRNRSRVHRKQPLLPVNSPATCFQATQMAKTSG